MKNSGIPDFLYIFPIFPIFCKIDPIGGGGGGETKILVCNFTGGTFIQYPISRLAYL